jgi:ABC-type branched-subunit amino acid transport system ATPase component
METIKIDWENCFGIGKLNHEFNFGVQNSNSFMIYAPNGTMKTSFAKTFDLVSKNVSGNMPCDKVYINKVPKYEIYSDGIAIEPDSILVINAEDNGFDASHRISNFLASADLKIKYEEIYNELEERRKDFVKKLKTISQSTDCETELIESFSNQSKNTFFEVLLDTSKTLKESFEKYDFRYNDVFDKKDNVKKFLDKNQKLLNQYVSDYIELLSKSKFFKQSNNPFGTAQANEILKSTEDNAFFEAGHKFVLEDGTEIKDSVSLKQLVQEEMNKILSDQKLVQVFEKFDKAIGSNIELRTFKKVIEKDNSILVELSDYNGFQKKVWINYLSEIKSDSEVLAKHYEEKKIELEKIIIEAKKEIELWKKIIQTFNSRFYVPFEVILVNQEDILLKEDTANLEFDYIDKNENPIRQNKENLLKILSKGEQRAYFILQFLFEIESRKNNPNKHLIILDDVADSFDYKNKFAIIEYIRDLHLSNNFRIIILTHNFDFYRTLASRISLPHKVVYMATKNDEKEIKLYPGQYRNDIFAHLVSNYNKPKFFISLIAFVRNIIEYTESMDCMDYKILTSSMHMKLDSATLNVQNIFDIFQSRLSKLNVKTIDFGHKNLFEFIFETADAINNDTNLNEINIENKITLAIAIRLKAESYLVNKLPEVDLSLIVSNQTNELYQAYKTKFASSPAIVVLDKVNMMTPENIHINAFMFEPLIDMSVNHLKDLYEKTCNLN